LNNNHSSYIYIICSFSITMTVTVIMAAILQPDAVQFYFSWQNLSDNLKISLGYQVEYIEQECNINFHTYTSSISFFHFYICYSHNGCYTTSWCTLWFCLTLPSWTIWNSLSHQVSIYWTRMQNHSSFIYIICSSFLLPWLLQSHNGCHTTRCCTFWFSLTIPIWTTWNMSRPSSWIYWTRMQHQNSYIYIIFILFPNYDIMLLY